MSLISMFSDVVDVSERVAAQNTSGERAGTWSVVSRNVPCRIWPMSARERDVQGMKDGERGTHRMLCASTVPVTRTCRVVLGGVTYDVVETDTARFGLADHHKEAVLRRVK